MPKSIMIVDDNEIIRHKLRNLFKRSADWVICAEDENGVDALEKARIFHPDFVVLDINMPTMDGLEAAPKLKSISPKSSIVMLTAFKDSRLEEKAYQAGVSWVLSKMEACKVLDFARILLKPDTPPASSGTKN